MKGEEKVDYTYKESSTHGLVIEESKIYAVNKEKYNPYDTTWKNEWRWILQQEDDELSVKTWFCFQFIKAT